MMMMISMYPSIIHFVIDIIYKRVSHFFLWRRKRSEDNTREWTGLGFAKCQRAVENREKWRKLVVKSPVAPQQPLWLRDR